jgi:hypothetical protein
MKHDYDTTLARIAGNIAAGFVTMHADKPLDGPNIAKGAVALARLIVAEVREAPTATIVELRGEHPEIPVSAVCILNGCHLSRDKSAGKLAALQARHDAMRDTDPGRDR